MRKVAFKEDFSPLAGPIALVTTIDSEGRVNVAPKSWISHICRQPDLLVLGCTRGHHTAQNLLANGECVLNFPPDRLAQQTWNAHHYMAPTPDEPSARGFTPVPAERVAPPRLQECRGHIEGRVESVKWYGDECIFFIEILTMSVDEEVAAAADPYALLRPIFYLGPSTYGTLEHSATVGQPDEFVRYVILLTPRPGVARDAALIRAHIAHLRRLDAAGRLVLCGPFAEGGGGMIIIRAETAAEAHALAAADPFVVSGAEDFAVRECHLSCEANNHMGFGD